MLGAGHILELHGRQLDRSLELRERDLDRRFTVNVQEHGAEQDHGVHCR